MLKKISNFTIKKYDNDFTVYHYDEDHLLKQIRSTRDFYEYDLLHAIKDQNPSGVFIDIGANIGNHSLFFAGVCNSTKVFSFEPNKEAFDLLRTNIEKNNLSDKIFAKNIAISNSIDFVSLSDTRTNMLGSGRVIKGNDIRTNTIDKLFQNTKDIGLIKIDVEGFEFKVIEGAMKTINDHKPLLSIELVTEKELNQMEKILLPLGYTNLGKYCKSATYIFKA